jgi:hypothetical protein
MTDTNAVVAVYDTHAAADDAVKELQKAGFDRSRSSSHEFRPYCCKRR